MLKSVETNTYVTLDYFFILERKYMVPDLHPEDSYIHSVKLMKEKTT